MGGSHGDAGDQDTAATAGRDPDAAAGISPPAAPPPRRDAIAADDTAAVRLGWGAWLIVLGVLLYRATLGMFLGGHCRYQPTCSQYMIDAVRKYGVWRGTWRGLRRIGRCHPWGGGGYDPA